MSVLTDMGFNEVVGHATEHYPFRVSESVKKTDDWFSGNAKVYSCGKYDVIPRLVDLQVFNQWLYDIGAGKVSIPNAVSFDWCAIVKEQASKFLGLMRLIEGAGGTEFSHPLWFGGCVLPNRVEMVDYDGVSEFSEPANAGEAEWWNRGWYLDGGITSTLEDFYFGPTRKEGMTDRMWAFSESYYTRSVQAIKESMIGNDPTYFRVPFSAKALELYCNDGLIYPPHGYLKYFYKGGKFENCKWKESEDATLEPKAEAPIVKFHDVVFPYILSDSVCSNNSPITVSVSGLSDSSMYESYEIRRILDDKEFSDPVATGSTERIRVPDQFMPSFLPHFSCIRYWASKIGIPNHSVLASIYTNEDGGYNYVNGELTEGKDIRQIYKGTLARRSSGYSTVYDYLSAWKAKYKDVPVCDFLSASSDAFEFPYAKNKLVFSVLACVTVYYDTMVSVKYLSESGDDLEGAAVSIGGETVGYPYFCGFGGSSWADLQPGSTAIRYKSYRKAFAFQVSSGVTCGTIVDIVNYGPATPSVKYIGHRDDYLTNPPKATNLTDMSAQVPGSTIGNCHIDYSFNNLDRYFEILISPSIDGITSDLNYVKMPIGTYKYNWRNYTNE